MSDKTGPGKVRLGKAYLIFEVKVYQILSYYQTIFQGATKSSVSLQAGPTLLWVAKTTYFWLLKPLTFGR